MFLIHHAKEKCFLTSSVTTIFESERKLKCMKKKNNNIYMFERKKTSLKGTNGS